MVYDTARQRVVLFGGGACCLSSQALNETWEWDNTRWTLKNPTSASPSPRRFHEMVYDSARRVIVLFGGIDNNNATVGDTWEYDGTTWTLKTPALSPTPRSGHVMTYDAARQRVVLFGGSSGFNETWEYDGTTWTKRIPVTSPPGRGGLAMAYDAARQRVVLFGGGGGAGSVFNETWEYDGTTWTQRTPATSPPGRQNHAIAYDSTHQVTVLFGGGNSQASFLNDTWLWDGTTWSAPVQTQAASVIDMSARPDGIWNYTTIDIPAGTKVSFKSNPTNTPVVWLATGPVRIAGEINLDGALSSSVDPSTEAPGGPGGGAGGLGGRRFDVSGSFAGTPGEGPGGGLPGTLQAQDGGGGGYGTPGAGSLGGPAYGNRLVRPLLGGSGGGGGASSNTSNGGNGGGGGGAILIASSDTIQISGSIHANGGAFGANNCFVAACGGGGSGGAIRLVASRIEGSGALSATGGFSAGGAGSGGAVGRIRLEAFFVPSSLSVNPIPTTAPPLPNSLGLATAGLIRITSVAGQVVPNPPNGNLSTPDVIFTAAGNITISLATTNIPSGTPLTLRITAAGQVITAQSTPTDAAGNAIATVTVPGGVGTIQAFATYVPTP
jgi:hypothetical protein